MELLYQKLTFFQNRQLVTIIKWQLMVAVGMEA